MVGHYGPLWGRHRPTCAGNTELDSNNPKNPKNPKNPNNSNNPNNPSTPRAEKELDSNGEVRDVKVVMTGYDGL